MDRPIIIVANWKMNKTIDEAIDYVKTMTPLVKESKNQPWIAVPFTAIRPVSEQAKETNIAIGAQNMNAAAEGAFTGEIAGRMLKDAGAEFVILGHSERRILFGEDNICVNRKVHRAIQDGLKVLVCVGESQEERDQARTKEVLFEQLSGSLEGVTAEQAQQLVLAYEPLWAIGSHQPASPDQAEEAHKLCRQWIADAIGSEAAERIPVLYGGSVKPENAGAMLEKTDIDGLLVGGASLNPESFSRIVNYQSSEVKVNES